MNSSTFRNIDWGPLLIGTVGGLLFLLGVARFFLRHSFGLNDALYCCLVMIPAGLLLLVTAYVIQHAILASVIPLAFAGLLAFSSPVFDVAIGLVLVGAVVAPAVSDWKSRKAPTEPAAAPSSENEADE